MFDASAKIPSGVLNLNGFDLGNFDECYNLEEVVNGETLYGKYCIGTIPIPVDMMKVWLNWLIDLCESLNLTYFW